MFDGLAGELEAAGHGPPTLRERLTWWIGDRVWDARYWLSRRCDETASRLFDLAARLDGFAPGDPAPVPPPLVRDNIPPPPPDMSLDTAMVSAEAKPWELYAPQPAPPPVITPTVPTLPLPYSQTWCDGMAVWRLVDLIVQSYDLPEQEVARCLAMVPPSQTHLFDTPQGWGVLADAVAAQLGVPPQVAFLTPSIN